MPEISEWSQTKWIILYTRWDVSEPTDQSYYGQGYVPLDVRMTNVEREVTDICSGLAYKSGHSRFAQLLGAPESMEGRQECSL